MGIKSLLGDGFHVKCQSAEELSGHPGTSYRFLPASSGNGTNSFSSRGTLGNALSLHARFAFSIASLELETKFHQMWRSPSRGAPPRSMTLAASGARRRAGTPARKMTILPAG